MGPPGFWGYLDAGAAGPVALHVQQLVHVDLQLGDLLLLGGNTPKSGGPPKNQGEGP